MDPEVVAGLDHFGRGSADQELENACGADRQADGLALRDRADRHAAGEPAGRIAFDRRVCRPLPPWSGVPLPFRAPAHRRLRKSHRLPQLVQSFRDAESDPAAPQQERSSEAATRAFGQDVFRADDRRADSAPRRQSRSGCADCLEMAPLRLPFRRRSAAVDDRPAKHAHGLQ